MPSPYGFPSLRYWPLSKQATSEWKGTWWPEQSRWTLQRCLTSSMGHGAAYFHRGTTPWPSYRLPDPCGLDFPPQPLAIPASPAPCPSSVLQGGSSVLPDPEPGGDHRLCQGPVMVHPQAGHSPWTHLNFSNLLSSESTSLPTTSSLTSLRPHVGGKSPTPEPPLPVSAQLLGTSCACCLSSYCPLCGSLHQHFSSLPKHFPTLHKNVSLPLRPLQLLPWPSLSYHSQP